MMQALLNEYTIILWSIIGVDLVPVCNVDNLLGLGATLNSKLCKTLNVAVLTASYKSNVDKTLQDRLPQMSTP